MQQATDAADFQSELAAIRGHLPERLGPLLEGFRHYLLAIARQESPLQLTGKVGASDLVQDTIVKGFEHFGGFEGTSRAQLACWLRQILLNHLRDVAKAYGAEKRDVAREQAVDHRFVAGSGLSPSRQLMSSERMEQFQSALDRLPEELRRVIELRHREDLSFAAIACLLSTSEDTARRLWARAIRQLQGGLRNDESSTRY